MFRRRFISDGIRPRRTRTIKVVVFLGAGVRQHMFLAFVAGPMDREFFLVENPRSKERWCGAEK
jgi:hypothetical protein